VRQALGDRARMVRAMRRPCATTVIGPAAKGRASAGAALGRLAGGPGPAAPLLVCARVDAAAASRVVDVGPAADDAK
jgi:hypothetical protein